MSGAVLGWRAFTCALGLVAISSWGVARIAPRARATPQPQANAALVPAASTTPPAAIAAPLSTAPRTVVGEGDARAESYPPLDAGRELAPVLVVLHGMCMEPRDVCDFWPAPVRGASWVVCPRGNAVCGGAPDWGGPIPTRVDAAKRSLAAARADGGARMDESRRVLVGYSRGAYLARDLLYEGSERFVGAVFLGAAVRPDPSRLRAAGVVRVVLAAGDHDGARGTMVAAAERLRAGGVAARFVSLGPMGHGLPHDLAARLAEPLAWAAGESASIVD